MVFSLASTSHKKVWMTPRLEIRPHGNLSVSHSLRAPWIISYSCMQISIFKIQVYTRQMQGKKTCPGWPTCSGKHTPPTLWKPCKRYVHSVVTCTLLLPSDPILVDSLLKLKKSHWCRKLLLKRAEFEEALQKPWFIGSSSMSLHSVSLHPIWYS